MIFFRPDNSIGHVQANTALYGGTEYWQAFAVDLIVVASRRSVLT